jgi:hypothetical protein
LNKGTLVMLGALVALVALIAGCGGGSSTENGGGSSTENDVVLKAEFIKQGDAICKKGNEESETELDEFAKQKGFQSELSKDQIEEAVTAVLLPNLQRQAEELDALGVPAGDEDEVGAIIDSLEETIADIEKDPSTFLEEGVLAKPIRLENAYGFKVCGGG